MKKELPKYLEPRDTSNTNKYKYIPKKIFQTGVSCGVTKSMYDAVHTWIDKNPDWEYHFFDNKACRDFIKEHFPKKVLDAYDNLIPGAYKADLWRYCVLYIHGGVYADIKQELFIGLNSILDEDVEFLSVKERKQFSRDTSFYIYQAFICSRPKHTFLKNAIDMIVKNSIDCNYSYDDLSITGPALLGSAINYSLKRALNSAHKAGNNLINGFSYVLWSKHNKKIDTYIEAGSKKVLRTEYSTYRKELYRGVKYALEKNYVFCWYFNRVYGSGNVTRPRVRFIKKIMFCLKKTQKKLQYYKLILFR